MGIDSSTARPLESRILLLRGHRVMLDSDLAALYGVTPKALNQAVKRNMERFPADFMFQLHRDEAGLLRSQIVTLKPAGQNGELARRLDVLESKYDRQFKVVFDAIRELMTPADPAPKRRIGFISGEG